MEDDIPEADQTTSVSSPKLVADGDEINKDVQNPAKKAKQDALTKVLDSESS